MRFISTRASADAPETVGAAKAIRQGLAPDGGLYVPDALPRLPDELMVGQLSYAERAARVLSLFFDELGELDSVTHEAYARFDDAGDPAPLIKEPDGDYTLELFHGPTRAFKDMALQVLPGLMTRARAAQGDNQRICILTATSGDTGKAALEGFADRDGTFVIVFYPKDGTSRIQELQMTTQEGENVGVCAVEGNFDDAQTGVKRLFADPGFRALMAKRGYGLSAANSINIGRLVPQIAYYVHAYADLVKRGTILVGDPINFCVPTGNFGNILAGLYAWKMGLPVGRLICASNRNRVLTDVLTTGQYSLNREFYVTPSPSMDILISSNFERAIHLMSGYDGSLTRSVMNNLQNSKSFELPERVMSSFNEHFSAYACDDEETFAEIRESYRASNKLYDPHTAVARKCLRDYRRETGDGTPTITLSTADPFKFPEAMLKALGHPLEGDLLRTLSVAAGQPIPEQLQRVTQLPIRFTGVVKPDAMSNAAQEFVNK